jgi:hypothetical protein
LALSVSLLTQAPEQLVSPDWQLTWQVLPLHTWPAAQTWPQKPQLLKSVVRSRQELLQFVRVPGQTWVQVPATQLWPAGHTVPQALQLLASVWRLMQMPLQAVCPLGQEPEKLDHELLLTNAPPGRASTCP